MKNTILITKDIMRYDYLGPYGKNYWQTPNIDELASKGTVFMHHYAAGSSTAMSVSTMFTGLNAYELEGRTVYKPVPRFTQCESLFDKLEAKGISTHVVWSEKFIKGYSNCYNENTQFHYFPNRQPVGPHQDLSMGNDCNEEELNKSTNAVLKCIDECFGDSKKPFFVWVHLPHVIKGKKCYGSDIDWFDFFVGEMRKRFDDDCIYISADHGHMNLEKGKTVYGYDVYDAVIHVPLITPKIMGLDFVTFPTSHIQLYDIIFNHEIKKIEYLFCDSAYCMQGQRKLAIIKWPYKYIYNSLHKREELYDIDFDPREDNNLLIKAVFDNDRYLDYYTDQIYFYPKREQAIKAYNELKMKRNEVWIDCGERNRIKFKLIKKYRYMKYIKNKLFHK